jgi:hypothetical protein
MRTTKLLLFFTLSYCCYCTVAAQEEIAPNLTDIITTTEPFVEEVKIDYSSPDYDEWQAVHDNVIDTDPVVNLTPKTTEEYHYTDPNERQDFTNNVYQYQKKYQQYQQKHQQHYQYPEYLLSRESKKEELKKEKSK